MKKTLTLVLALLLTMALVSPALAEVHLTVTSWRVEDQAAWDQINAAFTAEYPDITVEYIPVTATEYDSVLQTKLQSGNAEDIMFLRAFSTGLQIYNAGYVHELTEEMIPNLSVMRSDLLAPWTGEDGVVYGLPGSVCYGGFFYNKAIFEEVGVEPPRTFDEFMDVCQKIEDAGYVAIGFGILDSWMVAEYLSATVVPVTTGTEWHDSRALRETDYTDAGYIQHFDWIKQMAEYFPDGYQGIGSSDMQMMFASEMAAIYPVGTFELTVIESLNPDLDLGWFFMPTETADEPYVINYGAIMGYGINKNVEGEKLEAACTYLNWLAEQEASELFTNNVLGQYAASGNYGVIENELSAEIIADAEGAEFFIQIPYQQLSDQSPDYTAAIQGAIYKLLVEDATPEEAAEYMMTEQAWYFAE